MDGMPDVSLVFALIAIVIAIGFAGNILFDRTRIPDILILIGIGVLLGPVTNVFPNDGLHAVAPYFGALALVMILFEGGIELDLRRTLAQFTGALRLMVVSFVLSFVAVAAWARYGAGLELAAACLLGAVLACTSGPIIIPLLARMRVSHQARTTLSVESALSDAISVLVTMMLVKVFTAGVHTAGETARSFIPAVITGVVVACAAGMGWLYANEVFRRRPLSYMMTFAVLLLVYALVEMMHGSGAIAVLTFGLILGNEETIRGLLGVRRRRSGAPEAVIGDTLKWFHGEFSFAIRTFFFVFLGMLVDPAVLERTAIGQGAVLFMLLVAVRWLAVRYGVNHAGGSAARSERRVLLVMLPRGLASAVLATHPGVVALTGPSALFGPAFAVIVLTNMFMVAGVAWLERRPAPGRLHESRPATRSLPPSPR